MCSIVEIKHTNETGANMLYSVRKRMSGTFKSGANMLMCTLVTYGGHDLPAWLKTEYVSDALR